MPAPLNVKVTAVGADVVQQHLTQIQTNFTAGPVGQMIDIALQQVQDDAQSAAPVRTGALRDSIAHQMISENSGICFVGVDYGAAQEFGFVGKNGQHIPGRNYFRPAAMRGKKFLIQMFKEYMGLNTTPEGAKRAQSTIAGRRGRIGGGAGNRGAHKYLYKVQTGAGFRYVYSKKSTTVTTRKFRGRPSVTQQKGGGRRFRFGGKFALRRRL